MMDITAFARSILREVNTYQRTLSHHSKLIITIDSTKSKDRTVRTTNQYKTNYKNSTTSNNSKDMDFDSTLETVGDFGWIQIFHLSVLIMPNLFGAFFTIALSFVGKAPHFICEGKPDEDPCAVQPPCEKFLYDSSFTSIVTEWDLVCEKKSYPDMAQSSYMVGNFLGCLICGFLGDKYGRLRTCIVTNFICVFTQMAGAYVQTYEQFAINRLVLGFCAGGAGIVIVTLVLENLRSQWRAVGATIFTVSFALSICLTAMWAYRVREWRTFLWTSNVFMLPFFCLVWFVPQSPRWLASQGRTQEAEDILFYLGYKNGTITSRDSVKLKRIQANGNATHHQVAKSYGIGDGFKTPEMARRMRILLWGWLTCGLIYFGLTVSSSNLGGNMYVNVAMSGLVELPSAFLSSFLADRIGRNKTIAGSVGLTSIACLGILVTPTDADGKMSVTQTYLAMIAKMGIAGAFNLQSLYTNELLPTVIRNVGCGFCAMVSRLGGILAPILMAFCSGTTVYFVYGVLSAMYTLTVLTLPETLNEPLPEDIDDVENS